MPSPAIIAAFISTGLISLAPNLILLLSPHYGEGSNRTSTFLSLGQALAAGGLLGDVFLHTLPHAIQDGDEYVGLMVLFGFMVFLAFDMVVRSVGDHHHHHHHEHHEDSAKKEVSAATDKKGGVFSSTVVLNLAADALHNFTDGLAIGVSYATTEIHRHYHGDSSYFSLPVILSVMRSRGGVASMSVMVHEIPHELGDFAILVSAGFSKRQAIMAQFTTAVAAFCGTTVGFAAMHVHLLGNAMLPFTAGGFVYLAACSILPELLEEDGGRPATATKRILQLIAFATGVAFMYAVAIMEQEEEGHSHGFGHSHHEHQHEHQHEHHHEHHHDVHHHDHHVHKHAHKEL